MRSEADVNGFDVELLGDVLDTHQLSPKAAAQIVNRDRSTVSRYLSGEKTIPVDVFRSLFERTRDMRLLGLISGAIPLDFTFVIAAQLVAPQDAAGEQPGFIRIPPMSDLLPRTLESIKRAAMGAEHMAKIVSDGRVDESDKLTLASFRRDANKARADLAICLAALDAYERGLGGKQ